jgi:hypothetical protein
MTGATILRWKEKSGDHTCCVDGDRLGRRSTHIEVD